MNDESEDLAPKEEEAAAAAERQEGVVKWFNKDKGYGFVNLDDETRDIFVHFSEIQVEGFKTLVEGSRVSFELVENEKGLVAKDVKVLEVPPQPVSYGYASSPGYRGGGHYEDSGADHSGPPGDGGDYLNVHCGRTNVSVSFTRQGGRRRFAVESTGGPGVQILERLWRFLMQYEGVGADEPGALRVWLKIYKAFTGQPYDTQGHVPAWIGSEQARDELRVEGLVR